MDDAESGQVNPDKEGLLMPWHRRSLAISAIVPLFLATFLASAANRPSDTARQAPPTTASPDAIAKPAPKLRWTRPAAVRGVYATGWIAGSSKWFPRLVDFIQRTQVNSIVIDVKDDEGTLSYKSNVKMVREIGADQAKIMDPTAMMRRLNEEGIWPIARIVAFKDPYLAGKRPDLAVRSKSGGLWRDRKGMTWVDPNNRLIWKYNVAIAKEAVALGFREIQFDYVRFTSDGQISDCLYPFGTVAKKEDVIRDFLAYAREELKPLGVEVSADIFGLVTSAQDDLGIGQRLEKVAESVDIISPMVYPSHYARGSFGLANPDLHPYETVYRGLTDARKRLEGKQVQIRPWLQDFSLGNSYGREQIQAQIRAVHDAGVTEWIFWNPSNRYDASKY